MSTRRGGREGEGGLEKREKTGVRRGEGRGRKRLDYEGEGEGRGGRRLECKEGRGEEGRISHRPRTTPWCVEVNMQNKVCDEGRRREEERPFFEAFPVC